MTGWYIASEVRMGVEGSSSFCLGLCGGRGGGGGCTVSAGAIPARHQPLLWKGGRLVPIVRANRRASRASAKISATENRQALLLPHQEGVLGHSERRRSWQIESMEYSSVNCDRTCIFASRRLDGFAGSAMIQDEAKLSA